MYNDLRKRWNTHEGKKKRSDILAALSKDLPWTRFLKGFPLVEQVPNHKDLRGIDLAHADLKGADLAHCSLQNARLTGADLRSVRFTGSSMLHVDFSRCQLGQTDFRGSELSGTQFAGVKVSELHTCLFFCATGSPVGNTTGGIPVSIMIIDDNLSIISTLEEYFFATLPNVHRVLAFSNALEACEALAIETPTVILVDQKMPGITGQEFVAIARQDLEVDSGIIFITGTSDLDAIFQAAPGRLPPH